MSMMQRSPASARAQCLVSGIAGILSAALVAIVAMPPLPAFAEPRIEDIAGRWVREAPQCTEPRCREVYDFVPCGTGWCGIEVKAGGECRRVAFRLTPAETQKFSVELIGRFERAWEAVPYTVRASLTVPAEQGAVRSRMVVVGNTGEKLELFRRTYPLHMVLLRDGDATCTAHSGLS